MSEVDPKFPMQLWYILIPQTVLTLNLVRPSHVAPKVSSQSYLHGNFDYSDMPITPLGCAVQLYVKPHSKKSWAEHSINGYYIGTYYDNYMCHNICVAETKAEIVTDTVFLKHKHITHQTLTPEDIIIMALHDLKHTINRTIDNR